MSGPALQPSGSPAFWVQGTNSRGEPLRCAVPAVLHPSPAPGKWVYVGELLREPDDDEWQALAQLVEAAEAFPGERTVPTVGEALRDAGRPGQLAQIDAVWFEYGGFLSQVPLTYVPRTLGVGDACHLEFTLYLDGG